MAEQNLSIVSAPLDAPQQLQARPLRDAPPRLVFLPAPSGVPLALLAVPQALLDVQVSTWASVLRASLRSGLRQAQEQVPWEQSWVQQALPSA
jgi:hypothetical protein